MQVDLLDTALMGSRPVTDHSAPNLCTVKCGDQDTPVKIMFLAAPSPAMGDINVNTCLLSQGRDGKHATSTACSQDLDSTACDDAGTPLAVAEQYGVRKGGRPCKAKRIRYKNLVKRLEIQILEDPSSFDLEAMSLPPSLQTNDEQRAKLMQQMEVFKHRAKMCEEVVVNIGTL